MQAGLFTAIVTAFTIDAYKWLKTDSTDAVAAILTVISQQMANSSAPTVSSVYPNGVPSIPSDSAIRINCFWFLSISLSLSAALLGILAKQWIQEFQRDAALPPDEALALRQLRFKGFNDWGVPQIVSIPPIILQVALLLFFAGVLDLLWSDGGHTSVALCVTVIVALISLFMIVTTTLPAIYHLCHVRLELGRFVTVEIFKSPCPFKSPQSFMVFQLLRIPVVFLRMLLHVLPDIRDPHEALASTASGPSGPSSVNTTRPKSKLSQFLEMVRNSWQYTMKPVGRGWIAYENWLFERDVFSVCGQSGLLSPISLYHVLRSDALSWVQSNLAFTQVMRNNLFHCLVDSKVECRAQQGRYHHCLPQTLQQCESLPSNHWFMTSILNRTSPATNLDLLLRSLLEEHSTSRRIIVLEEIQTVLLLDHAESESCSLR